MLGHEAGLADHDLPTADRRNDAVGGDLAGVDRVEQRQAALDRAGFTPGAPNTESALFTLTMIYAALPCVLKLTAITLLARTPVPDPIEGTAQ